MAHVSTVTIAASQVPADQSDFQVLLPTPSTDSAIWSDTTPSGGDIRIFASDGTTEWAREIVSFDATAKTCEIWVKVPFLSSSSDTAVQIHADGASSDYAVIATYGRNNVWSGELRVFHLKESSGATATDSTGNADGTFDGTLPNALPIGQGFNGTSDFVNCGSGILGISGAYSLRAFINPDAVGRIQQIFSKDLGSSPSVRGWQFRLDADYKLRFIRFINSGSANRQTVSASAVSTSADSHVAATFSTGSGSDIYINGASAGSDANTTANFDSVGHDLHIGRNTNTGAPDNDFYAGGGGWYRLSADKKDDTWITTEYNNQSAPNTFATWADEAAVAVPVLGAITATATTANSISFSIPVSY